MLVEARIPAMWTPKKPVIAYRVLPGACAGREAPRPWPRNGALVHSQALNHKG